MSVNAGTRIGRYEINSLLGAGGMGEVYLARDVRLRRSVALKLLPTDVAKDADRLRRFEQEAFAASALNHPNILTIYEIGHDGNVHFIATELVEGMTLRTLIAEKKMTVGEVVSAAVQIASALTAAHDVGIVHRDVKPENIMVRNDGYVKVLDFGLAKLSPRENSSDAEADTIKLVKTQPGTIVGTVNYMSPEQARGTSIDERTDIWSFGVILYEMLTGKTPFQGETSNDIIAAILKEQPTPIMELAQRVPTRLQRIIDQCLVKDAARRPQNVSELTVMLRALERDITWSDELHVPVPDQVRSVAILPFHNLARDTNVNFYEFSLADAVITELLRLRSLVVRPSSAIAKYSDNRMNPIEAGRELQVQAVLSASFLHAPGRVRVTAQLLDVGTGDVLWGDRIDSQATDIIAIQDVIAQRIVEGLNLRLYSNERVDLAAHATTNVHAYEEYLRGRDRIGHYVYHTVAHSDVQAAAEHFQRAIGMDPTFALAHCGLGICYMQRVLKGAGDSTDLLLAHQALQRGLALDPWIVEARLYMFFVNLSRGEKPKSRLLVEQLLSAAPNNASVHFAAAVLHRLDGEYEEALNSLATMLHLNPGERIVVGYNRARILMYQGRYHDARRELDQISQVEPDHPLAKTIRAKVRYYEGDAAGALELLEDVIAREPELHGVRPLLAIALSSLGKHVEANEHLTEKVKRIASADHDIAYWLASAYLVEGQLDEAFQWFEQAISLGNENLPWFESNPIWKPVHDDPRFKRLVNSVRTARIERHNRVPGH